MTEDRELFGRAIQRFVPPERAFERLITRRDRKQRNKRITAGVLAFIVALAGIGAFLRAFEGGQPAPADPMPSPLATNGDITFVGRDESDMASLYLVDPTGGTPRTASRSRSRLPPSRDEMVRSMDHKCRLVTRWDPHRLRALRRADRRRRRPAGDLRDGGRHRPDPPADSMLERRVCVRTMSSGLPMGPGSHTHRWITTSATGPAASPARVPSTP